MAGGRPTKYRPILGKKAEEHLSKGYSKRATAGLLGIDMSTFQDWEDKFPEFSSHIKLGSQLGEQYYISKAKGMVEGNKGNFQALQYMMANIYRWRSEPKDETEDSKPIQINFTISKPTEDE
jgi:hypothetical protein